MEILNEKIKKFLQLEYGDGSGDGSGYGDGDGSGDGSGSGSGYGYGDGSGGGGGYGYGVKSFDKKPIYLIDNIPTILIHIFNNVAQGFILNADFSLNPCYIVKGNNYFAHRKNTKRINSKFTRKNI